MNALDTTAHTPATARTVMAAFARPFVPLLSQFGARETVELRRVVKGAGVNTGGRLVDIVTAASSSVDQVVAAIGTLPHMCSCCCGCMRACGCTCVVVCVAVCGCVCAWPIRGCDCAAGCLRQCTQCMRVPTWLVHRCLDGHRPFHRPLPIPVCVRHVVCASIRGIGAYGGPRSRQHTCRRSHPVITTSAC